MQGSNFDSFEKVRKHQNRFDEARQTVSQKFVAE